jgi:hypothetical protein
MHMGAAVVGVVGGVGGVGASTFAAVLAARIGGVLLDIDADGGGIDVLLGVEDVPGARWSAVRVAGGRIEPRELRDGLVRWGAVPVLAADAAPPIDAVRAVLAAAAGLGPVVVDLGRAATAARSVATDSCGLVVVLVPADVSGVAGARAVLRGIGTVRTGLVVRRGAIESDEVGDLVGVEVIGELPQLGARAQRPLRVVRLPRPLVRIAAGVGDGLDR